jgi:hypothetical protein
MIIFEAWEDDGGVTFSTPENISDFKQKGLLSGSAKFLHYIHAKDYEEAMALHHQKMGWEPYKPMKDK